MMLYWSCTSVQTTALTPWRVGLVECIWVLRKWRRRAAAAMTLMQGSGEYGYARGKVWEMGVWEY